MFHEVHNELEPVPTQVASMITQWVHAHVGETIGAGGDGIISGAQDQTRASGNSTTGRAHSAEIAGTSKL